MKVKAAIGLARILKAEGVPWVACYPTNHVNNALGEEKVPILMMREERDAVAVADAFSRVTGGKKIGVCTIMGGRNAAGIQLAYGAVAQAFEDSSPLRMNVAGNKRRICHADRDLSKRHVTHRTQGGRYALAGESGADYRER
jgi:thiamine pyrophosphate-dependent acetolactate synthase large subunit-like protein